MPIVSTAGMQGAMSKIRLADGREILLSRLYQRYTYEGVLAGLPTHERNAKRCQDAITNARENPWLSGNAPVTLIPPKIEHVPTRFVHT